jgi:hypothetical protein
MPAVRTDLGYFPRPQLGVKVLDDRIGTDRGDHSKIQDAPDPGATTLDTTAFAQATAVAVKGRQSGQRRDLLRLSAPSSGECASRVVEAACRPWARSGATRRARAGYSVSRPGITVGDITAIRGGLPMMLDGNAVGAIGVGGGDPEQDEQCAKAGWRRSTSVGHDGQAAENERNKSYA